MWQDWVIVTVQTVFAFSLLPTVFHPTQKPTLSTAVITVGCIFVMVFIFATLSLWFAATMAAVNALLWAILAFQRYRLNKESF